MSATILPYITQSELAQALADEFGVTYCVCDWQREDVQSIVALPYEHARSEPRNLWHRGAA